MHHACPSRSKEGAGDAGCWPHPWPASNKKSWRQVPQVQPEQPAFPARCVTAYTCSPRCAGLFGHRRSRDHHPASLTPASGCQDHTPSPSAPMMPVLHHHRVHRIPSHDRDDAFAPLAEAGQRSLLLICRICKAESSCTRDQTESALKALANFACCAGAFRVESLANDRRRLNPSGQANQSRG